jgi:hypothetical protein
MITAIVVPVDPREPLRLEQIDRTDLDAYRRLVDGHLEVISLDRPPASLYLNEEGKLLALPVNPRATALLWMQNTAFRGRDVVAGPAFIVGPADRDGYDRSTPQDLIDLLFDTKRYRVQVKAEAVDQWWRSTGQVFTGWFDAYIHGLRLAGSAADWSDVRVVPELDEDLRETWFQVGRDNPWIRSANDPPFTRNSFVGCYSIEELEARIGHGNWATGTAFYYRDLCFINQVDSGDEWLTIRYGIAFESMTLSPRVEDGSFAPLVRRLLTASKEQCQQLEY